MIGGFVQNQPLICGGGYQPEERYFRKCFIVGQQKPVNEKIMMLEQRSDAASIVISQNTLWIIGGRDKFKIHPSTEFLTISSPPFESTDGPTLPFTIHRDQSFTSLMADLLSGHKQNFFHLAGALMEHFLEGSAPLRLW